jgi:hypothetical protein
MSHNIDYVKSSLYLSDASPDDPAQDAFPPAACGPARRPKWHGCAIANQEKLPAPDFISANDLAITRPARRYLVPLTHCWRSRSAIQEWATRLCEVAERGRTEEAGGEVFRLTQVRLSAGVINYHRMLCRSLGVISPDHQGCNWRKRQSVPPECRCGDKLTNSVSP